MRKLVHFLGSITLALILIALTALLVIFGTLLESKTGSHLYASSLTYSHPWFHLLLGGFFLNIFVSTARRWPFRKKHIPFLLTHLGLLMVIAGVMIKGLFGTQGVMLLVEGGATQTLFLPDTYAIAAETRSEKTTSPLKETVNLFPGLTAKVLHFARNARPSLKTWIKEDHISITGFKPTKIVDVGDLILKPDDLSLLQWNVVGVRADDPFEVVKKVFDEAVKLKVLDTATNVELYHGPFQSELSIPSGEISLNLKLYPNSANSDFSHNLGLEFFDPNTKEMVSVPLSGGDALCAISKTAPYLGAAPVKLELTSKPLLVFIQGLGEEIGIFALDLYGRAYYELFHPENLISYLSYDDGFKGYAVTTTIPLSLAPESLHNIEAKEFNHFRKALEMLKELPPLKLLQDCCRRKSLNFQDTAAGFVTKWHHERHLIPLQRDPNFSIDRTQISPRDYKTCCWIATLFKELEQVLLNQEDPFSWLQARGWPFTESLNTLKNTNEITEVDKITQLLDLLVQQIYGASDALREIKARDDASLLGAYMRLYGLEPTKLISQVKRSEVKESPLVLETRLSLGFVEHPPVNKLEQNRPALTLLIENEGKKEILSLPFAEYGQALKWPVGEGSCLVRFQNDSLTIPYRIRLRNARQIHYAASSQAFSFECELLILDTRNGAEEEVLLSMNKIHETWDGWRFYLSHITPEDDTAVHKVQLAVSLDPAKYYFTYPGGLLLSVGILLLFWLKPYRKS